MGRPTKQVDQATLAGRVAGEIRRRRLIEKLSVDEAAAGAGVPAPTWYHWESGRHLPLDRLPAIAAALGCGVRQLIPADYAGA